MHTCINCNRRTAVRSGDTFSCSRCGYEWDVAHEQANAAYLLGQGRKPARVQDGAQVLDAALGLTDKVKSGTVSDLAGVPNETGGIAGAALEVINAPEDGEIAIDIDAITILDTLTVRELEELADTHGVDLSDARLKEDKILALLAAEVLTFIYDAGAEQVIEVK